ncbi:MAG: peptide deformylase [bacterium]|nr:peptide deformylase [bacterium]
MATKEGIWVVDNKQEVKILRKKMADFDFKKYKKPELNDLIKKMREIMKNSNGIGLSANQIGLDSNFFIAQVEGKFYAIFNPKILKFSDEIIDMEEGCLSVPEVFGNVRRPEKIVLEGFDKNNKKLKIKAWGLLARVFQHEVDHLNGKVFIDHTKDLYRYKEQLKTKN